MRAAVMAVLLAASVAATAQDKPADKKAPEKKTEEKAAEKEKPRPRVMFKRNGGSIGDDAAGGGPRSAEPSRGGTPGTPSGSFTRP
jgi:hypothetical protein